MTDTRTRPDWIACPTCDGAGGYSPTDLDDLDRFARTDTRTPRELLEAAYGELDRFGPVARSMLADKVAATPSGAELLRRAEDAQRLREALETKAEGHRLRAERTAQAAEDWQFSNGYAAAVRDLRAALASPPDAAGTVERGKLIDKAVKWRDEGYFEGNEFGAVMAVLTVRDKDMEPPTEAEMVQIRAGWEAFKERHPDWRNQPSRPDAAGTVERCVVPIFGMDINGNKGTPCGWTKEQHDERHHPFQPEATR